MGLVESPETLIPRYDDEGRHWYVMVAGRALTTTMWREAGLPAAPEGALNDIIFPGSVYHFDDQRDAEEAGAEWLSSQSDEFEVQS